MTKLEQEIADRLFENFKRDVLMSAFPEMTAESFKEDAKAAAEVAKKWMDQAVEHLISKNITSHKLVDLLRKQYRETYQRWLKENGL